MIAVLHRGGPANECGVPKFRREYVRNFVSADLTKELKKNLHVNFD